MVKNAGGGKTKGQARKYQGKNKSLDLRVAEDTNELYAIVETIYGNGLNVYTNTGKEIWCRIPGKFKGPNKRNNFIEKGAWVLIGIYEWENGEDPKMCELIHLYERSDVDRLQRIPGINLKLLNKKANLEHNEATDELEDYIEDVEVGFKFTEEVINKQTMFANDITNEAVVKFQNDWIDVNDM